MRTQKFRLDSIYRSKTWSGCCKDSVHNTLRADAPIEQSVWHCSLSDLLNRSMPVGYDFIRTLSSRPVCFILNILFILHPFEYPLRYSSLRGSPGQSAIFYDQHRPIKQLTSD